MPMAQGNCRIITCLAEEGIVGLRSEGTARGMCPWVPAGSLTEDTNGEMATAATREAWCWIFLASSACRPLQQPLTEVKRCISPISSATDSLWLVPCRALPTPCRPSVLLDLLRSRHFTKVGLQDLLCSPASRVPACNASLVLHRCTMWCLATGVTREARDTLGKPGRPFAALRGD